MNSCKLTFVAFSLLTAMPCALAATTNAPAHVVYAGVYGTGRIFVQLDATINDSTCPSSRFDVAGTNPMNKQWLAIALAAQASGKTVGVQTYSCIAPGTEANTTFPTLTTDGSSFFYINQ